MNIKSVAPPITIVEAKDYPKDNLNEFCFVGRSNVGKSSLINSLLGRKNIAYTSQKPGKTQTINFYKINDAFYIVDVPGYGYAKVSKVMREKFAHMIETYLTTRDNLKHVFVLLDFRHPPSEDDLMLLEFLIHYQIPCSILATKADKISKNQRKKHEKQLLTGLDIHANDIEIIPYSAITHENKDKVLNKLAQLNQ